MQFYLRSLLCLLTLMPLALTGAWFLFRSVPLIISLPTAAFVALMIALMLEPAGVWRRNPQRRRRTGINEDHKTELRLAKRVITAIGGCIGIGVALWLMTILPLDGVIRGAVTGAIGAAAGLLIGYAAATVILRE